MANTKQALQKMFNNFQKLLLGFALISLISCKEKTNNKEIHTAEISFTKEADLYILNKEKDTLKHLEIELAEDSYEQQTGLMHRPSMKENRGMLFVYPDEQPRPNFYMKNTAIDLDLIYINAQHKIVDFNKNAQAFKENSLPSEAPAKYVLEVNADRVEQWNLSLGDSVILKK